MKPPETQSATSRAAPSQADAFAGDPATAIWLPSETVANAWMQFVRGEPVADTTPPPSPTDLKIVNGKLTWRPIADLQSGILHHVVRRSGKPIGQVPASTTNAFGRPLGQGLQFSDTPNLPLKKFHFKDSTEGDGKSHQYTVTTVNTAGLESQPSEALSTNK